MQLLEKQYLEALESNLIKQTQKEKTAKLFYINCAKKIQASYRKYLLRKKKKAAKIILKYYQKWKKGQLIKLNILACKNAFKVKRFFQKLKQFTYFKKTEIIIQEKDIQKLQPLIRFIQNYQRIQQAKRRKFILILIRFRKVQLSVKKAKATINQYKLSYYKQQMKYQQQKIAIMNEIKFISNLQELNDKYFELGLQNYQNQVFRSAQQKDFQSDFIEMKNNQGKTYWQNLKTLKKYDFNPMEQILQSTLDQLEDEQVAQYQQQMQYLENGKIELMSLLQNMKPEQLIFPNL